MGAFLENEREREFLLIFSGLTQAPPVPPGFLGPLLSTLMGVCDFFL